MSYFAIGIFLILITIFNFRLSTIINCFAASPGRRPTFIALKDFFEARISTEVRDTHIKITVFIMDFRV